MIDIRERWIATACALAISALASTASTAAPTIQDEAPTINGTDATLAQTATSSNDTQPDVDPSRLATRPGIVNDASAKGW